MMGFSFSKKLLYAAIFICAVVSILTICFLSHIFAYGNSQKYADYVPGKAIVCVEGGSKALSDSNAGSSLGNYSVVSSLITLDSSSQIQEAIGTYGSNLKNQLANLNPATSLNNSSKKCEILLIDCENTETFIEKASKVNCILWAQPDYVIQTNDYIEQNNKIDNSSLMSSSSNIDTDPLFPNQWAYDKYNNIGSTSIDALDVWNYESSDTSDYSSVVAVIDSGVDYMHPDLEGNMWNGGNIPALTALGGGTYGFNAIDGEDSSDPMDRDIGHGTHCASIIGSPFNNVGVMGVNGNNAKIMACRFISSYGGDLSNALKCFNYIITAKKNGVNVSCISNSWGNSDWMSSPNYALESVATEAGLNGIVSCFSSGNDSLNMDDYPYRTLLNPFTITVGSCDDCGNLSSFSNYGEHSVDFLAPGNVMLSCVSRYQDVDTSQCQYISWINDEQDSYFCESFESANPKITLSSHIAGKPETVVDGQYDPIEQCSTIDLSSYKEDESVLLKLTMSKEDLQELIKSGDKPYISFQFSLEDVESARDCYGLRYVDGEYEPVLFGYWILRNNHYKDACNWKLDNNSFYQVKGDTVSVEIDFTIKAKGSNPIFKLYDFGFGKKPGIYALKNGTSCSCPLVAGIVSNIYPRAGVYNVENLKRVIALVKGSTQDSDTLSYACINPGIVNFKNAYDGLTNPAKVHPVIDSINETNSSNGTSIINLKGYFFGNSGSIDFGNTTVSPENILSWNDNEIQFCVPSSAEQLSKFTVTRRDGQTGRNYFLVGSEAGDYINLPVSDIQYNVDGYSFKASDFNVLRSATTDRAFYCLYGGNIGFDTKEMVMEKYDYLSSTWSTVDISNLNINKWDRSFNYSMASGQDEIYLLYLNKDYAFNLATYSEVSNCFVSDVAIDCACLGDMIGNVDGKLLLCGKNSYVSRNRDSDIVTIFPDTGNIDEELGFFPDFGAEENDVLCGNISVYDNNIYISDAFCYIEFDEYCDPGEVWFCGPVVFNGDTWSLGSEAIYEYTRLQKAISASSAVSTGLISQGIWIGYGGRLYDTWIYNYDDNEWLFTPFVFSDVKNRSLASVCHNNNFYIIGQRSVVGGVAFKYLPLEKIDANSQNVSSNVQKEIVPVPVPDPEPEPIFIPALFEINAGTGDNLINIICLLIILLLTSFMVYYLRKTYDKKFILS